jgi:hypothetical protein
MKRIKDICPKCAKRETCKTTCYPVERYLRKENKIVLQRGGVLYPKTQEQHRSSLSSGDDKAGNPRQSSKEAQAFSTENENPFRHYEPRFKQTSVFIKRFFAKWSYKDIAVYHDISTDAARKIYHAGVKKLVSVLIEMDKIDKMTDEERKRSAVARQKRYLEKNREKVNAKRRERYARNKEKINAKRRSA